MGSRIPGQVRLGCVEKSRVGQRKQASNGDFSLGFCLEILSWLPSNVGYV